MGSSHSGRIWYYEVFQIIFSCPFDFQNFPFDMNKCCLEYGTILEDTRKVFLNAAEIIYGNMTTKDGFINVKNLPFPFDVKIESQPAFEKDDKLDRKIHSYTGMCFTVKRNSYGQLVIGFYLSTLSFAVLSLVSFLIKPDIVST